MSDQYLNQVIPDEPQDIPVRPLVKGMIRNIPSQGLPPGAVWTAENFLATTAGLRRRPGWSSFVSATGNALPAQDLINFWKSTGVAEPLLFDTKFLYKIAGGVFSRVESTYTTGTLHLLDPAGASIVGDSTLWATAASDVAIGDFLVIDPEGAEDADNGGEEHEITGISTNTALTINEEVVGTYGPGTAYKIVRCFGANDPYRTDWILVDHSVVFTDFSRTPRYYDGTDFAAYGETTYVPECCEVFKNRVFIGNIMEGATARRTRLRWSGTTGSHDTFGANDWVDRPEVGGRLMRLLTMGSLLVLYFDEAIWVGRPSNIINSPLSFERVDTGGVGLIGARAVHSWIGGHFCVLKDNIHFLSNRGLEPIGTSVVADTVKSTEQWGRIQVALDPANERVCFGFPGEGTDLVKMWSYHYRTKAWSYDVLENTSMIARRSATSTITWDSLGSVAQVATGLVSGASNATQITGSNTSFDVGVATGDMIFLSGQHHLVAETVDATTLGLGTGLTAPVTSAAFRIVASGSGWDAGLEDYASWDDMQDAALRGVLFKGTPLGAVKILSEEEDQDEDTSNITAILETGDMDYNKPNLIKTAIRLSLKIDTFFSTDVTFQVEGSKNRGNSWESLEDLVVEAGYDEGHIDFKLTGSTHRFRLTTSSQVTSFTITEIMIRIVPKGQEVHIGAA